MINNEFTGAIKSSDESLRIEESLSCVLLSATTHNKLSPDAKIKASTEIGIRKFNTIITIAEIYYKPISKMITDTYYDE